MRKTGSQDLDDSLLATSSAPGVSHKLCEGQSQSILWRLHSFPSLCDPFPGRLIPQAGAQARVWLISCEVTLRLSCDEGGQRSSPVSPPHQGGHGGKATGVPSMAE